MLRQAFSINRIVHRLAAPLALDETSLSQNAEMLRDGRLGDLECTSESTDAQCALFVAQQLNQPQPRGVRQSFEHSGQLLYRVHAKPSVLPLGVYIVV
jgi:hypothetical protein